MCRPNRQLDTTGENEQTASVRVMFFNILTLSVLRQLEGLQLGNTTAMDACSHQIKEEEEIRSEPV